MARSATAWMTTARGWRWSRLMWGLRTERCCSGGARSRGCARGRVIGARLRGLIPRSGTDAGGLRCSGCVEPRRRHAPARPGSSFPARAAAQLAAKVEPASAAALEGAEEHRVIGVPRARGRREGRAPEQPRRHGERSRRRCRRALRAGDGHNAERKRDEHEHGEHDFDPGAHRAPSLRAWGAPDLCARPRPFPSPALPKDQPPIGGCVSGDVRSGARVKQPASDGLRPIFDGALRATRASPTGPSRSTAAEGGDRRRAKAAEGDLL